MRRPLLACAVLASASSFWACAPQDAAVLLDAELASVREATEALRDVEEALARGYVRDPLDVCETPHHLGLTGEAGVMGIHFLRKDLLGIGEDEGRLDVRGTHVDFAEPAVLVYEPRADGSLELVALENLVSAASWRAAGHRAPPSFAGQAFHHRPADPAMSLEAQYDLHLWLYRENPLGLFAPYNPEVSCRHHEFHMPMMHR